MIFIAIVGESKATKQNAKYAEEVGFLLAKAGAVLVCGGLRGVMEAASRGAKKGGGLTIGILPGSKREEANPFIDIPIVTGLGYARNKLVVKSGQVVIAIGGSYGTLSEIGFALGYNIPVIGLNTWRIHQYGRARKDTKILEVNTPEQAVKLAIDLIRKGPPKVSFRREFKT